MRRLTAASRALALLLASSACEEPDPLDPDELQRLARAQGDARGGDYAGLYLMTGRSGACACPELQGVDLCRTLSLGDAAIPVVASQHDGLIVLELADIVAYLGGVDRDGTFAVAAILNAGLIAATGELLSRIDGEFSDGGFVGVLQNRLVGAYLAREVDCRVSTELTALKFFGP